MRVVDGVVGGKQRGIYHGIQVGLQSILKHDWSLGLTLGRHLAHGLGSDISRHALDYILFSKDIIQIEIFG